MSPTLRFANRLRVVSYDIDSSDHKTLLVREKIDRVTHFKSESVDNALLLDGCEFLEVNSPLS